MLLHHGTPSSATGTDNDIAAAATAGRTPATAQPTAATAAAAARAAGADGDSRCGHVSTRPCPLKPATEWLPCTSKVDLPQRLGHRLKEI